MGSKKKESSRIRQRNVMYEQQIKYCPYKSLKELESAIKNMKPSPEKYALIEHDKDINDKTGELVEPHFHAFMKFKNPRSVNQIAKDLNEKSQQITIWNGKDDNGFAYLCHRTEGAKNKYQYDPCDVIANFDYIGFINELDNEDFNKITAEAIELMLNDLYKGNISKSEVENRLTGKQYAKYKRSIDDISMKCLERQASEWRASMIARGEHIRVIWIYGEAGVGKTRLAKHYAEENANGNSVFMSGSSRDMFQNYAGEHIVILDELRPHNIPYSDLMRILDPYSLDNGVCAPSRYNDKTLAVGLFIITTPYDPTSFYNITMGYSKNTENLKIDNIDSFNQLRRRISLVVKIDKEKIYQMKFDDNVKHYIEANDGRENTFYNKSLITESEATDIYKSLF